MASIETKIPSDRRITLVLTLTAVVVLLVGLGTPAVISTSNTTQKVVDGTNLNACRAQANAKVTDARTGFDVARSQRDTLATHLTGDLVEGLVAAVTDDDARLEQIVVEIPKVRADVDAAEQRVVEATKHLRDVADDYAAAVVQSREDPAAFLDECEG